MPAESTLKKPRSFRQSQDTLDQKFYFTVYILPKKRERYGKREGICQKIVRNERLTEKVLDDSITTKPIRCVATLNTIVETTPGGRARLHSVRLTVKSRRFGAIGLSFVNSTEGGKKRTSPFSSSWMS
jgi:hypothetical protein